VRFLSERVSALQANDCTVDRLEARKKDRGDVDGDFEVLLSACKSESIESIRQIFPFFSGFVIGF
jgi:hypothetical protein